MDRLKETGVIPAVEYSEWAAPTVLNQWLTGRCQHYTLTTPHLNINGYVEFVDSVVRPKLPALKEFDVHKQHLDEFL